MYCSGCGHVLETGKTVCSQCGRPVPPDVAVAGPAFSFEVQLDKYSRQVRMLGILWLAYAGVSLLLGFVGMSFLHAIFSGGFGPWAHGSDMPEWIAPAMIHFTWIVLSIRVVLCAVAGWGLLERTQWGRIVAIVAAILSLIHIPLGTALGIATLVILLGYRNSTLYEQL